MTTSSPVSVFMTVLNEESHIEATLDSILGQDYEGPIEIVVACGPSSDATREVLERYAENNLQVSVIDNPSGITPVGLNAAISKTQYDVLVRVDGHAVLPSDYVRQAVEALQTTGAVNVGGIMAATGESAVERAIAAAMTSHLGVGGAAFHVGGPEGPTDSVYLGSFKRSALEAVGGYDESFVRAQDWELNLRLRNAGGTIWFNPKMRVTYRPRQTFVALASQYRDYGRWRRHIVRANPATLSLRYLAAPIALISVSLGLVLALAGGIMGLYGSSHPWTLLGLLPLFFYLVLVGLGGTIEGRALPWPVRLRIPAAIAVMHASWGWGFLTSRKGTRISSF